VSSWKSSNFWRRTTQKTLWTLCILRTMSFSASICASVSSCSAWTYLSSWRSTTSMDLTRIWSVVSQSSCCTLWNTWKCSKLSTAIWNQRTSCSKKTINPASRWSISAHLLSKTKECTLTFSRGSIGRLRLCLGYRMTVRSTCGVLAVSAPSCTLATLSSLVNQSRIKCLA